MANPRSAKAKGRRLQNFVRDELRQAFPFLHEDDIKSQIMGVNGEDIVLSPAARKFIPYSIECKNVEKLNFWACVKQTEDNIKEECCPALIVKKNGTKPYVAVPIEEFIKLVKQQHVTND
jgi:hypothetical protein